MINLSDNLTVVITTHVLPTAPSTQVLEECVGSIRDRFKGIEDCNFIIYCDTRPDDSRSSEYIRNIRENIPNITLIENPNFQIQSQISPSLIELIIEYYDDDGNLLVANRMGTTDIPTTLINYVKSNSDVSI